MGWLRGEDAVEDSLEFRRIAALPRRVWDDAGLTALAERLTAAYKTPTGTMTLRPVQALALHDIAYGNGLLGPIRVGGGKTLISLLAPLVTDARRPVLLLPAGLRQKTERDRATLLPHWRIPRHMQLLSYEGLGRVSGAGELDRISPDLIVMDECHRAKNLRAGVTRRLARYLREHPDVRVVAISGTVIKHSLKDFAHIARWALREMAPVPDERYVDEWADALDEQVNPLRRLDPGPLVTLARPTDEGDPTTRARLGFQRRLTETPGVVKYEGGADTCDASIYIRAVPYDVSQVTEDNFQKLRSAWLTPDDWPISEAIVHWRHARELALGFHGVWDPRPPDEWMVPRKGWASFVRRVISNSRHLDTELQVVNAVRAGELDPAPYNDWSRVRASFVPHPKDVWHDDAALEACIAWMHDCGRNGGIVWCEHKFFAKELARRTKAKYYGAGGLTKHGEYIEDADPRTCIIASIAANGTGKNLQRFSRNLFTAPPMGADACEQTIGRTHRSGQEADEVTCDFLMGCWEHWDGWAKARADARMAADMLGQSQKILLADVTDMPTEAEMRAKRGARWHKVVAKSWEIPD